MLVLDVKYCEKAQKCGNSVVAHARKVLPFSVTNELDLEITSAIRVPNLVNISEKLRPLALTKEKISLLILRKSVAAHAH